MEYNKLIGRIDGNYSYVVVKFTDHTTMVNVLVGYEVVKSCLFDEWGRLDSVSTLRASLETVRTEYMERAVFGVLGVVDVDSVDMYWKDKRED